jgi:hypothetical protein
MISEIDIKVRKYHKTSVLLRKERPDDLRIETYYLWLQGTHSRHVFHQIFSVFLTDVHGPVVSLVAEFRVHALKKAFSHLTADVESGDQRGGKGGRRE